MRVWLLWLAWSVAAGTCAWTMPGVDDVKSSQSETWDRLVATPLEISFLFERRDTVPKSLLIFDQSEKIPDLSLNGDALLCDANTTHVHRLDTKGYATTITTLFYGKHWRMDSERYPPDPSAMDPGYNVPACRAPVGKLAAVSDGEQSTTVLTTAKGERWGTHRLDRWSRRLRARILPRRYLLAFYLGQFDTLKQSEDSRLMLLRTQKAAGAKERLVVNPQLGCRVERHASGSVYGLSGDCFAFFGEEQETGFGLPTHAAEVYTRPDGMPTQLLCWSGITYKRVPVEEALKRLELPLEGVVIDDSKF